MYVDSLWFVCLFVLLPLCTGSIFETPNFVINLIFFQVSIKSWVLFLKITLVLMCVSLSFCFLMSMPYRLVCECGISSSYFCIMIIQRD